MTLLLAEVHQEVAPAFSSSWVSLKNCVGFTSIVERLRQVVLQLLEGGGGAHVALAEFAGGAVDPDAPLLALTAKKPATQAF